jgi:hypothetical protein
MITVSGSSDDIVCISGMVFGEPDGSDDSDDPDRLIGRVENVKAAELASYDACWRFTIGEPEAKAGQDAHGCIVVIRYGDNAVSKCAVWVATVAPIDEDIACPWPVRVRFEGYSAKVEVDAPVGTAVLAERLDQ